MTNHTNCLGCLEGGPRHAIDCPLRGDDEHSMRVDVRAARRQERVDILDHDGQGSWWGIFPASDEHGAVSVRLLCGVAGAAALALFVWAVWPYLVGLAVMVAGWRVATAHTRRRRPRSSWSSLGRTVAAMYAAWNSRWLKGGVRVSVPARAGREHLCGECGRDDTAPF